MRVVTVTLNPCVDQTCWMQDFDHPPLRIDEMSGGKGINVARVLRALNDDCLAIAPYGGETGAHFYDLAVSEGVPLLGVPVSGNTRTVTTYVRNCDYHQQVSFEKGPDLTLAEIGRLREIILDELSNCAVLAVCGSACCDSAARLVPEIIREARLRNVRTLLDSNKDALLLGAQALPDVIKPNLEELSLLADMPVTRETATKAAEVLLEKGVPCVLASLGEQGALMACGGMTFFCPAPKITCVNPVGSGDSFVAGWLHAQMTAGNEFWAMTLACAAGAANAAQFPAAKISKTDIEKILGYSFQ